jgi:hypothetical protein
MMLRLKYWLFRQLFPHHALAKPAADLRREYERKLASAWQTSSLDESEWVRKFATLDEDYRELADEAEHLRNENRYLSRRVLELVREIAK